jgi:uncharacterized membrane protein YccC
LRCLSYQSAKQTCSVLPGSKYRTDTILTVFISTLRNAVSRNVALRLTLASMIAMSAAVLLGLAQPWWAAMAVWMIGQPPRGLLFERSLAQLVGTVLGALVGTLLVIAGHGSAVIPLLGLSLWTGICCAVANMMRHQRAYGAMVSGLTAVVIVALTVGTNIDPVAFAVARVLGSLVGIAAALGVAIAFGPPPTPAALAARTGRDVGRALQLMAEALTELPEQTIAKEREFLLALAVHEATAEDAAAGSLAARRELRATKNLFSCLLDLVVVARAIRSQDAFGLLRDHADLLDLQAALGAAASGQGGSATLEIAMILTASRRLALTDRSLTSVLDEMRVLLERVALEYARLGVVDPGSDQRDYKPHADTAGLKLASIRGAAATLIASLLWLALGWEPFRFLLLGTGIFTTLFSVADEPAPAVRQIFLGGLVAAGAAAVWRLLLAPEVSNVWLSLALALPLVFIAALLQTERRTMFAGLAFNMLFAVLARQVDQSPAIASALIANEAMLMSGIVLNYTFFRWVLPMDVDRRCAHLRFSVRREIQAIAVRSGTVWAPRHLARLRYLALGLAVRSGGHIADLESALNALTLGHALLWLGEMAAADELSDTNRATIGETLRLIQVPDDDFESVQQKLNAQAGRVVQKDDHTARLQWLLDVVAREYPAHATGATAQ